MCMCVLSYQPETLVTTVDAPVKVCVGTFYHILATILNLGLEMRSILLRAE
jgi:hypothetical protein